MKDHVGFGALNEAFIQLSSNPFSRILVITSKAGWSRLRAPERKKFFAERETTVFSGFTPNPDIKHIMAGVEIMRECNPDLIIACGGGSPIDVAKMMKAITFTKAAFCSNNPQEITVSGDGPPLVAIATTAGSGSEATPFAVFYKGMEKQSVASPYLRPDMAVADPELTYDLPPYQTAATGLDALSQGVESYWSSATSEEARELAGAAIRYSVASLADAVNKPAPGNRYAMSMAAYLSGKAITLTRTTLPHALAYHLTKVYGLPHGHAVALTIPYFFLIHMDETLPVNSPLGWDGHKKNMENLFSLLGCSNGREAWTFWQTLMRTCGVHATLREAGIDSEAKLRALTESMNPARLSNQPVAVTGQYLLDAFIRYDK